MTEERMIRVVRPTDVYELDRDDITVYTEIRYYGTDAHLQRRGESRNIDELELAPPKDFKPKCYYEYTIIWQSSEEYITQKPSVFKYDCESCDIRESCIYKRE